MNDGYEATELHRTTLVSREVISVHRGMELLVEDDRVCPCQSGTAETYRGDEFLCVVAHGSSDCTHDRNDGYRLLRAYLFRGGEYLERFEVGSRDDVPKADRHPALAAAFRAARGRKQTMERLYYGFGPGEGLCVAGFFLNRMNRQSEHLFVMARRNH